VILGHEEYRGQKSPIYGTESLWGGNAQHNEKAEWIRGEERMKITNLDWVPIQGGAD
jgi:hypothetical protein